MKSKAKTKPASPDYPVPALEKGLDILQALAAADAPQSLAGLAEQLNRSRSELFRMLNCLERRGYVTRDPISSKYALSLKLFTLAHGHTVLSKLLEAARQPMQMLTDRVRQSCHLSVLDQNRLLVVAQEVSPEPVRISIEVGAQFDPIRTASGRLLLASLPERQQAEIGFDAAQALKSAEYGKAFETIRKTGVSSAESETVQGVRDLAVLVGAPERGIAAALAISRLMQRDERTDDARLVGEMRATALAITKTLGLAE